MAALEARHLAELTFSEVSRALRALSSTYVERRGKLAEGAALSGAGKRAAFALFYGPLHHILITHIVTNLPDATRDAGTIVDLGCGTGASGVAWAASASGFGEPATIRGATRIVGIDRHPWAVKEAAATYRAFGVAASMKQGDIANVPLPHAPVSFLAAFAMNELGDAERDALLGRLIDRASRGDRVLIVEPLAGFVARWWKRWQASFEAAGGRADEWRLRTELPPIVAKLDRAAGLNHREITGRSLWLPSPPRSAAL
jgi:SAM-dependent methyltransferase